MVVCIEYEYSRYYGKALVRKVSTYDAAPELREAATRLFGGDALTISDFALAKLAEAWGSQLIVVLSESGRRHLLIPHPLSVQCEPVRLSESDPYFDGLREHIRLRDGGARLPRRAPVRSSVSLVASVGALGILLAGAQLTILSRLPAWLLGAAFVAFVVAVVLFTRGRPWMIAPGAVMVKGMLGFGGSKRARVFQSTSANVLVKPHFPGWMVSVSDGSAESTKIVTQYEAIVFLALWQAESSEAMKRVWKEAKEKADPVC